MHVLENKFYADTAGTIDHPAAGADRTRSSPPCTSTAARARSPRCARSRPPAGRGWEYLTGTGWDFDAEIAELPELLAEHVKAPSVDAGPLRPGHRPVQPVADHPRVDRARHRTRPGAGLRGGLRRHVASPPSTSSARCSTAARVMNVTGDRTVEHGLATHRLRRRGRGRRSSSTSSATACWSATSSTGRWRRRNGFGRSNGCAFADSAGHIPLQRMANVSLQPGPDGPSHRRS